ncbi:MAG: polysaccharide biosynthesis protein, partial [Alloprevotella sp.]|nr:polysaccharide biosynthesis protein [Alloprevotella sp.]
IVYTGLRPGEKLYEEVLNDQETVLATSHERIKIARVREYEFDKVSQEIIALIETAKTYDQENTIKSLKVLIPEYHPQNPNYQKLFQA